MRSLPLDRRAAVLGAAIRVFAQRGYRGTSMGAIATEAEISRPALYQYFADKEAVFRAAAAWSLDGVAHDIAERARVADDVTPRERVRGIMSLFLRLYGNPELGRIRAEIIDETYVHAGDLWSQFEGRVLAVLAGVLAETGVHDPADVAVVLLHGAEGIALKAGDRAARDRHIALLVALVLPEHG